MPTTPMYRVTQVATGVAGSPYYMTGYFDASVGTALQAANAWRTFLNPGTTSLRSGLFYEPINEVPNVDPVTGQTIGISATNVPSVTFTNSSDPLPPANQLLVRWRTNEYADGKEIRGRTFLPGYTEPESTGGTPIAALLTASAGRITALLNDVNSQHVVYSPKNGVWEDTILGSTWAQWAVLRSRRD